MTIWIISPKYVSGIQAESQGNINCLQNPKQVVGNGAEMNPTPLHRLKDDLLFFRLGVSHHQFIILHVYMNG